MSSYFDIRTRDCLKPMPELSRSIHLSMSPCLRPLSSLFEAPTVESADVAGSALPAGAGAIATTRWARGVSWTYVVRLAVPIATAKPDTTIPALTPYRAPACFATVKKRPAEVVHVIGMIDLSPIRPTIADLYFRPVTPPVRLPKRPSEPPAPPAFQTARWPS